LKFQGKTALITGSGTGIGKAIATKFVENGASVIILGRRREPLDEASKDLEQIISEKNSGASVKIFAGVDVADEAAMNAMFDTLKNDNVNVDYIINNAGVSGPVTCFPNSPLKDFKSTIGIHLTGTFWGSVQALKVMKEEERLSQFQHSLPKKDHLNRDRIDLEVHILLRKVQRTDLQKQCHGN